MRQDEESDQPIFWPQLALILGLGGAIFAYFTLTLTQGLIQLFSGGRVIQGNEGLIGLILTVIITAAIQIGILVWLLKFSLAMAAALLGAWLMMYIIIWLLGMIMAGLPLLIYLICWVLFGLAGGYLLGGRVAEPSRA